MTPRLLLSDQPHLSNIQLHNVRNRESSLQQSWQAPPTVLVEKDRPLAEQWMASNLTFPQMWVTPRTEMWPHLIYELQTLQWTASSQRGNGFYSTEAYVAFGGGMESTPEGSDADEQGLMDIDASMAYGRGMDSMPEGSEADDRQGPQCLRCKVRQNPPASPSAQDTWPVPHPEDTGTPPEESASSASTLLLSPIPEHARSPQGARRAVDGFKWSSMWRLIVKMGQPVPFLDYPGISRVI
ncbi:hypothetical protein LXA43DRAFT_1057235 [Ganoderma leucocontextum]|nr:hypothetical protein LXA43DRAFT_1057235 [Ganoderma leucocontextum]